MGRVIIVKDGDSLDIHEVQATCSVIDLEEFEETATPEDHAYLEKLLDRGAVIEAYNVYRRVTSGRRRS